VRSMLASLLRERRYYLSLTPVYGWSNDMSIEILSDQHHSDTFMLGVAGKENKLARYWRYLDSAGISLDEYLHSAVAVGIAQTYLMSSDYSRSSMGNTQHLKRIVDIARSRQIPPNSALTVALYVMFRQSSKHPIEINTGMDSAIETEWFWHVYSILGDKEYSRLYSAGVPVGLMLIASGFDIDADLIAALDG